jgi:hypothetical protein
VKECKRGFCRHVALVTAKQHSVHGPRRPGSHIILLAHRISVSVWENGRFEGGRQQKGFGGRIGPRTLEFAYVLNEGTVHEGTPFSDFSIFAPLHTFFGIIFYKIGIYNPDLALRGLFQALTQWEGGF